MVNIVFNRFCFLFFVRLLPSLDPLHVLLGLASRSASHVTAWTARQRFSVQIGEHGGLLHVAVSAAPIGWRWDAKHMVKESNHTTSGAWETKFGSSLLRVHTLCSFGLFLRTVNKSIGSTRSFSSTTGSGRHVVLRIEGGRHITRTNKAEGKGLPFQSLVRWPLQVALHLKI